MAFTLKKISKGDLIIVNVPSKGYKQKELEVLEYCATKYDHICYVNTAQSHKILEKTILDKHFEKKVLIVDSMCKENHANEGNCIHIGSPQALTKLSMTISKALQSKAFSLLLFDSISSLLTYNKAPTVTRFVHDLFTKLKKYEVSGVFTVQSSTNADFMADISMFADHITTIGGV